MVHNIVKKLDPSVVLQEKDNSRSVFLGTLCRFNTVLRRTYGSRQVRVDAAPCKFAKHVKHRTQHFRVYSTDTTLKTTPIIGT